MNDHVEMQAEKSHNVFVSSGLRCQGVIGSELQLGCENAGLSEAGN